MLPADAKSSIRISVADTTRYGPGRHRGSAKDKRHLAAMSPLGPFRTCPAALTMSVDRTTADLGSPSAGREETLIAACLCPSLAGACP